MSDLFPKHRLSVVSISVTVVIGIVIWRLISIQIIDHERYEA